MEVGECKVGIWYRTVNILCAFLRVVAAYFKGVLRSMYKTMDRASLHLLGSYTLGCDYPYEKPS